MFKKIVKYSLLLFLILIIFLVIQNEYMAYKLRNIESKDYLDKTNLNEIHEVLRVKNTIGNEIFTGFKDQDIGIIYFNDKYEFLYTNQEVSGEFEKMDEDIYRRKANDPQAFAVLVGNHYVGSIPNLDTMNKMYFLGVRSELPIVIKSLFPYQMASIKRDMHVSVTIHEMFHAYQAEVNEEKFIKFGNDNPVINNYPYSKENQEKYWNKEGELLYKALHAESKEETINYTKQFLIQRNNRRRELGLNKSEIEFEKGYEWLEGLAKYAEIKSYELAYNLDKSSYGIKYKDDIGYWKKEIKRLNNLGDSDDFRFYISGYAQARILDKLEVNWQEDIMLEDIYLEDLLNEVVN